MDIPLILEENYPTALWGGSAADYSKLNWKDTIIPKPTEAELLSAWQNIDLNLSITDKIIEMSAAAGQDIVKGFWSSALGTPYFYDAQQEDQLNLIGVVAAGTDSLFSCRTSETILQKTYFNHTAAQLQQVMSDGKIFKLTILQKFNIKKNSILACTTIDEINLITWL